MQVWTLGKTTKNIFLINIKELKNSRTPSRKIIPYSSYSNKASLVGNIFVLKSKQFCEISGSSFPAHLSHFFSKWSKTSKFWVCDNFIRSHFFIFTKSFLFFLNSNHLGISGESSSQFFWDSRSGKKISDFTVAFYLLNYKYTGLTSLKSHFFNYRLIPFTSPALPNPIKKNSSSFILPLTKQNLRNHP